MKDVDRSAVLFGVLTWYMDRVLELVLVISTRTEEFLAVVHLRLKPPLAQCDQDRQPRHLKWARTHCRARRR